MENNIAKTQERARENAPEFDEAWGNDDYNFDRGSRASSPGDDYIDVEGHGGHASSSNSIHRSMGAEAGSSHTAPAVRKPAPPGPGEVKRGRGRPRKQRDPVEEGKWAWASVTILLRLIDRSRILWHFTRTSYIHIYTFTLLWTSKELLVLIILSLHFEFRNFGYGNHESERILMLILIPDLLQFNLSAITLIFRMDGIRFIV